MKAKHPLEYSNYRYGRRIDLPRGHAYDSTRCAEEVFCRLTNELRQCQRRRGYGPHKLFCLQHAKRYEE